MTTHRDRGPGRPWAGPAGLWASMLGTVVASVGVLVVATDGLAGPWPLLSVLPGAVGLLVLPFRALRQVGAGLAVTLLVPALAALGLWAAVSHPLTYL